jgi:hypothetical protein
VVADVADVDVANQAGRREVADPGEDFERRDLSEVGERLCRVDGVAEPVPAK